MVGGKGIVVGLGNVYRNGFGRVNPSRPDILVAIDRIKSQSRPGRQIRGQEVLREGAKKKPKNPEKPNPDREKQSDRGLARKRHCGFFGLCERNGSRVGTLVGGRLEGCRPFRGTAVVARARTRSACASSVGRGRWSAETAAAGSASVRGRTTHTSAASGAGSTRTSPTAIGLTSSPPSAHDMRPRHHRDHSCCSSTAVVVTAYRVPRMMSSENVVVIDAND